MILLHRIVRNGNYIEPHQHLQTDAQSHKIAKVYTSDFGLGKVSY